MTLRAKNYENTSQKNMEAIGKKIRGEGQAERTSRTTGGTPNTADMRKLEEGAPRSPIFSQNRNQHVSKHRNTRRQTSKTLGVRQGSRNAKRNWRTSVKKLKFFFWEPRVNVFACCLSLASARPMKSRSTRIIVLSFEPSSYFPTVCTLLCFLSVRISFF